MKLNCTKGLLSLWPHVNRSLFTNVDMRQVLDEERNVFVALVMSRVDELNGRNVETISPKERDANANLFALAPEMLQLLIDQQELRDRLSSLTYDEVSTTSVELARRRVELLERMKAAGVISEEGS